MECGSRLLHKWIALSSAGRYRNAGDGGGAGGAHQYLPQPVSLRHASYGLHI